MKVRIGDYVNKGDVLAEVYSSASDKCLSASKYILDAIEIRTEKPKEPKLILDIIKQEEN